MTHTTSGPPVQNLYRPCRIDHFYASNGWRTRYMRIEYTTWIASLSNEGSTIWFILLYQLESDSDNERQRAAQSQSAASYLSKTMLITHPARKCVFEFLRVIMTDSLMSPSTAAKGQGVIDAILEVRNKIGISTKLPWVFTRKTRLTCIHSSLNWIYFLYIW